MTAGIAYPADYSATYSGPVYTANQGRTALSAAMGGATSTRPLGGISGVRPGTPSTTVTATSTTWTAAAFAGYIDTAASATNGGYYFSFPSGGTSSVTAAAASARIDIIYVQLSDVNTGDGTTVAPKVDVLYLAGTAGSGVPPTTPARSFVVAQLNVPATGGGSPTVTWVAPVCFGAGGAVHAETLAHLNLLTGWRAGAQARVFGDSTATNNGTYMWTGSAWGLPSLSGTLSLGSGYSLSSGTLNQLRLRDGQVTLVMALDKSSTIAGGDVVATLPAGFRPPALVVAGGFSTSSNAPLYFTIPTSGAITVFFGSGSPTNARLHIVFETA